MREYPANRLVSIILTTLNCAQYLRESIDSCVEQTYQNIELIIVDGGSTDGTLEIIANYTDSRLRLVHQPGNTGKLPGALNLGLDHACGEYLTWMQGDCRYHPKAIEKMAAAIQEHPEVGQAYADYNEINADGQLVRKMKVREPGEFLGRIGDPVGVCFLIRREVREAIGPHDLRAYPSQDYDYRMRIALQFASYHIPEALYDWRAHEDSLTGQIGWLRLAQKDIEIRRKLGLDTLWQSNQLWADVEIAYAFECYQAEHYREVIQHTLAGLCHQPSYLRNRGVCAILVHSLLHCFL